MFCRRIYILFTKSAPSKKHPLPIPTKMAFWGPYWEQCLPFVYKKAIIEIVLSPNSHRNDESTPPYSILSSIGSRRKCTKYKFSDKKLVILIYPLINSHKKTKINPFCSKNLPSPIRKKWAFVHPARKNVYELFTSPLSNSHRKMKSAPL